MAIPASAALLGLLLRNAYAVPQESPSPAPALLDGIVAIVFAFVSQKVLALFAPELLLPHWAPTQGGVWGLEFLVIVRHLMPPSGRLIEDVNPPLSMQELHWRLEEFDQNIEPLLKGHLIAAASTVILSLVLICTGTYLVAKLGAGLILDGALFLAYRLSGRTHRRRSWVDRRSIFIVLLTKRS